MGYDLEAMIMVDPKKSSNDPEFVKIPLRKLPNPGKALDEFAHRFQDKYKSENLEDLLASIKERGVLEPPVVASKKDGVYEIIGGHRRVSALHILADRNVPDFTSDMDVACFLIRNASKRELLVRSIIGNELARKLDIKERLLAVKKANEAGASKKELATMCGISEKSIERDLKIVCNPRILKHVIDDNLPPTSAASIVEIAEAKGRLDEFIDYFDKVVVDRKKSIIDEDMRVKKERGKGLKPNQMLVMNSIGKPAICGWADALAKGQPLTMQTDPWVVANFDRKSAIATINVKVDARNDPKEFLARVAGQVSQVAKQLALFAKTRKHLEPSHGSLASIQPESSCLDRELLQAFDLDDMVVGIEEKMAATNQVPSMPDDETAEEL